MVEKKAERNVMLNASDANAPRYIQIGLPSEDVNVYENGLPVVYSSYIHPLSAHWRSDGSLAEVGLMNPQESGPEEAKRFNGYVMSGRYLRPFTVEFGANGGSKVASQTVPRNAAIKEPTAPTKEDFDFAGWNIDKELKTEYDFTAKVTSGFTFCAAWTEKEKIGKSDNPHHRREGRVRFRSIENK